MFDRKRKVNATSRKAISPALTRSIVQIHSLRSPQSDADGE